VATTIRSQIMTADRWCLAACGARDYGTLDANKDRRGGLQFRVTITSPSTYHLIHIELTHTDEYRVKRIKIKRGSHERITEERATVTVDNLADTLYRMCNK
jgi:hypothetical protein